MQVKEARAEQAAAEAEVARLETFVLQEERALAEQQVSLAERHRDLAQARLENTRLKAALDGVVLEILRREGARGPGAGDAVLGRVKIAGASANGRTKRLRDL